jgi:2-hydroxy-6-oxonona-2,4-dienedioate hydrolase
METWRLHRVHGGMTLPVRFSPPHECMSRSRAEPLQSRWDGTSHGLMHARAGVRSFTVDAPVVVLVHGLVISSLYMAPTAERLAPFLPVIAPDLPGFGLSDKPRRVLNVSGLAGALLEWMVACELTQVVLVGNSLGCQVIGDLALRVPERIVGAVLAGPTVDPRARSMMRQIGRGAMDAPREKLSLVPRWAGDFLRAGVRRSWRTLRHALDDRLEDKLPSMTMPVLVVRGSRDPIVPQAWAEQVSALLPRGRLHVIRGAPHAINFTNAGEFAEVIREFVAGIPSAMPVALAR